VIVKVGDKVKAYKVGQRAGYKPIQNVCHACEYCKQGKETYCVAPVLTGLHIDGGSNIEISGRQGTDSLHRLVQAIRQVPRKLHNADPRWCIGLCCRPSHVLGVDDLFVNQGIRLKSRTVGYLPR
jgi:hypothetical protein